MAGKFIDLMAQPTFAAEQAAWSERLRDCDWFHNVGAGNLAGVKRAKSWDEAIRLVSEDPFNRDWDDMSNDVHNMISTRAAQEDQQRYNSDWNDIVRAVESHVDPLVKANLDPVLDRLRLPRVILKRFRTFFFWHFIFVAYFSEVPQASMDRTILEYYMQGHFPCGYHGEYPDGKLIVY
jgi:hypothetical protein